MAERNPNQAEEAEVETVPEVSKRVQSADIAELRDIEAQERSGPARKGVLEAVESRRQELMQTDDPNAAVYTLQELMDGAEAAFGVTPEVVAGAMRLAGVNVATRDEAQNFVNSFITREV